jgi:putative Ca2+/H+ antiporter (TMEM165/GDT1 family)
MAEMGDKTQLLALAFASKYKARTVILAIAAAAFLNHLPAVIVGNFTAKILPMEIISLSAGILFILFGVWTLRGDQLSEKDRKSKVLINPFFTVGIAFFIAEMGDKTQLATITLSMKYLSPVLVLLGTVFGMIAADIFAIIVGLFLGKSIPEKNIKWFASSLFLIFGFLEIWQALNKVTTLNYAVLIESSTAVLTVFLCLSIIKKGNKK